MNRMVATSAMSAAAGWFRRSSTTVARSVPIGMSVAAGCSGWPSQVPLSRSLIGRIGRNSALSQRWLKSPNGRAQPSCAAMIRANRRPMRVPPTGVYPQAIHSSIKFGDNFRAIRCKFVDKPVVADMAAPVVFVLPEGAG
jgi:hypothetical protein